MARNHASLVRPPRKIPVHVLQSSSRTTGWNDHRTLSRIIGLQRLRGGAQEGRRQAPDSLVTGSTLHPKRRQGHHARLPSVRIGGKGPPAAPFRGAISWAASMPAETAILEIDHSNESLHGLLLAGRDIDGKVGHVARH